MNLRANMNPRGTPWMVALLTVSFSLAAQTPPASGKNEPVEQLLERELARFRAEIKRTPKADLKQAVKDLPQALGMPQDLLAQMESAATVLDTFDEFAARYVAEAKRVQLMIALGQHADDAAFRAMWRKGDAASKLADDRLSAATALFGKAGGQLSSRQLVGFAMWGEVFRELQEHTLELMAKALESTTKELSNARKSRK